MTISIQRQSGTTSSNPPSSSGESGANLVGPGPQEDRQPASGAAVARHIKLESTVRYLGIEVDDALAISEQVEL